MKKALITGIFGQDGSYLCELLYQKEYEVHGIIKTPMSLNSEKNKNFLFHNGINPILHEIDLASYEETKKLLTKIQPDEIYHLAAIHQSSEMQLSELNLFNNNILVTSTLLDCCNHYCPNSKFIHAGSCLMYDNISISPQTEMLTFNSRSLYGLAKITENNLIHYYKNQGLFACTAILYNHESSRRKDDFVTKKIIKNMVAISNKQINEFSLGDINIQKDWGYAKDYAFGMYLMAQQNKPDDYILSTNSLHTIKDIIELCAEYLNINNWEKHIKTNTTSISRNSKTILRGDNNKAKTNLNWQLSITFEELINLMIQNEINNTLY